MQAECLHLRLSSLNQVALQAIGAFMPPGHVATVRNSPTTLHPVPPPPFLSRAVSLPLALALWSRSPHIPNTPGFRVQGSKFRVQGSGFRVQGSGFGVWGLGLATATPEVITASSHESATYRGVLRPRLREGGPISYEARPSAFFQPNLGRANLKPDCAIRG